MAGITSAGFDRKLEADIFAETITEARAAVDPAFDDSPDSTTGQLTGIVASKWAEAWEVLEAVFNGFSVSASGAVLDRLAGYTGTVRQLNETDAQLRLRRIEELGGAGATTEAALRAALSAASGVLIARVISNRTMVTINSRPAKSVEVLALGGTDAALAQIIWDNLPAGIESYGTTSTTVTDSEGIVQPVKFTRPAAHNAFLRISVRVDPTSYVGDALLKTRLNGFTSGAISVETTDGVTVPGVVPIEGILYRSRISAAAQTVGGVVAVTEVLFSGDGVTWVNADYALPLRTYLGLSSSLRGLQVDHITVAVV
jgi:hypothetical protein